MDQYGIRTYNSFFCRWCSLERWNRVSHVVCLVLEDLGADDILKKPDSKLGEAMKSVFPSGMLEFVSPASYDSDMARELAVIPVARSGIARLR